VHTNNFEITVKDLAMLSEDATIEAPQLKRPAALLSEVSPHMLRRTR
jgi:hypothetical protein